MYLKFSIPYKTKWGEKLVIDLTYVSADGYQRRQDIPMQTADGYLWTSETFVVKERRHRYTGISYYYKVIDGSGKEFRREDPLAVRSYPFDENMNYTFPDFWLEDPMERKGVIPVLKKNTRAKIAIPSMPLFSHTMLFKIYAPRLTKGEAVAIVGNHPVLGAWNVDRYLPMKSIGGSQWMLCIDTFPVDQELSYKYVVVDVERRAFKRWEHGEDRKVTLDRQTNSGVFVLNGGEFRDKPLPPSALFNFDTYVFDLDGTLLDTLEDLAASCNYALLKHGFPERTVEEVRRFVGNGVRKLMERAVPKGTGQHEIEEVLDDFRVHYLRHGKDTTAPYDGIPEILGELKARGKKIAVVSNKFYAATQELCQYYFPGLVDVAIGEREDIRKKPAPDTVEEALRQLDASKETAVYIGDSDVDIQTARNCGMPCISVLWGFRDREFLLEHGATMMIYSPSQLI